MKDLNIKKHTQVDSRSGKASAGAPNDASSLGWGHCREAADTKKQSGGLFFREAGERSEPCPKGARVRTKNLSYSRRSQKPIFELTCVYLFAILLFGCSKSDNWNVSHVRTGDKAYNSSKLSFAASDPINGIDVEMLKMQNSFRTYLQVHSHMIPAYKDNPKEAFVSLESEDGSVNGLAIRHEGGQRLLLSDVHQKFLLSHLIEKKPVTIRVEGYSITLNAENFSEHYEELQSPSLTIPFRIPYE